MQIEIDVPRPVLAFSVFGGLTLLMVWVSAGSFTGSAAQASLLATPSSASAVSVSSSSAAPVIPIAQTAPVPYGYPVAMPMPSYGGYPSYMQPPMYTDPRVAYGYGGMPGYPTAQYAAPASSSQASSAPSAEEVAAAQLREQVMSQQEEYLRDELAALEQEGKDQGNHMTADQLQQFQQATREVTSLLQDKQRAEDFILSSFTQLSQAESDIAVMTKSFPVSVAADFKFAWPVAPTKGISAFFHDASYFKLFHREHNAVDIPTPQGSTVKAPAEGIVVKVADNGYGFSYLIIQHPNGLATLYGHLTKFLVKEGDRVQKGQSIALSGGEPGSLGAGLSTTGPHLHFQVSQNGEPVDPLQYLPAVSEAGKE